MTKEERVDWLKDILAAGPAKKSWKVDLSHVDQQTLPLIDTSDPESSPSYDHLILTVEGFTETSEYFISLVPEDELDNSQIGFAATIANDGMIHYLNESLLGDSIDDADNQEYVFDGTSRSDPTGQKFEPHGQFREAAMRFDSFLELVTVGHPSLLSR